MDSNGLSDPYTIVKLFAAPGDKKECDKVALVFHHDATTVKCE